MFSAKTNTTVAPSQKVKSNSIFFQPKLTVNQPNDVYEQEADAVADKIMRKSDASKDNQPYFFTPSPLSVLQRDAIEDEDEKKIVHRKCAHCEEEEKLQRKSFSDDAFIQAKPSYLIQRKCAECEKEEKELHRKENSLSATQANNDVSSYVSSLSSKGSSLSNSTKSFFEPRFGYDFSDVKVHNDTDAAKSAQSVNALAYTTSNNIVFNQNQYSPETDSGKKLLAHELTHVVQQDAKIHKKEISSAPIKNFINPKSIQRKESNDFQAVAAANKCNEKNEKKEDKNEVKETENCKISSVFPEPAGTCNKPEDKPNQSKNSIDQIQNQGYCYQAAQKKVADFVSGIFSILQIGKSDKSNSKTLVAKKPFNPFVLKAPVENEANVEKENLKKDIQFDSGKIKKSLTLLDINNELNAFALQPFSGVNASFTQVSLLNKIAGAAIKNKCDKISGFIHYAQSSADNINVQSSNLKEAVLKQSVIHLSNQKKSLYSKKRELGNKHSIAINNIKSNYSDAVINITNSLVHNSSALIQTVDLYKQLLDLGEGSYEMKVEKNFIEAQMHYLQAGLKYGKAADYQSELRAIRYEYALDEKDSVIKDRVLNEKSDGFWKGKLSYNRYMARAAAARQVGSSYESALIEQGQQQANKIACGMDAAKQVGSDLLKLYFSELGCFLDLGLAQINDQASAALSVANETYSTLVQVTDAALSEGLQTLEMQSSLYSFFIAEFVKKETNNIDNSARQASDTIIFGTGNAALGLWQMIEFFEEEMIKSLPDEKTLVVTKTAFEKKWDNEYNKQIIILNGSLSLTNNALKNASVELLQPLNIIDEKGISENQGLVDKASAVLKGISHKSKKVFIKIGETAQALNDIFEDLRQKLIVFHGSADKKLRFEIPEQQRTDLLNQTNCFEQSLYDCLAKDSEKSLRLDKVICYNAEKAAAEVKPRWKFWAKILIIIAFALIGLWAIAAIIEAGLLLGSLVLLLTGDIVVAGSVLAVTAGAVFVVGAGLSAAEQVSENLLEGEKWYKGVGSAIVVGGVTSLFGFIGEIAIAAKILSKAPTIIKLITVTGINIAGTIIADVIVGHPITLQGIAFGAAIGIGLMFAGAAFNFIKGKVGALSARWKSEGGSSTLPEGALGPPEKSPINAPGITDAGSINTSSPANETPVVSEGNNTLPVDDTSQYTGKSSQPAQTNDIVDETKPIEPDNYQQSRKVEMNGHTDSVDGTHELEIYKDGSIGICSPVAPGAKCRSLIAEYGNVLNTRPRLRDQLRNLYQRIAQHETVPQNLLDELSETEIRLRKLREVQVTSIAPKNRPIMEITQENFPYPPPHDVILEFPEGQRVWTNPDGRVVTEYELAPSVGTDNRKGYEDFLPVQPKGMQRGHQGAPGTGFETPYGITGNLTEINQQVQNHGIEAFLGRVNEGSEGRFGDIDAGRFKLITESQPYAGTTDLEHISYRIDAISPDGLQTKRMFEFTVNQEANPLVNKQITIDKISVYDTQFLGIADMAETLTELFRNIRPPVKIILHD